MVAAFNTVLDYGGVDGAPGFSPSIDGLGPPNLRFKQADNADIDNANPIPIPTAGTNYSRWKQIYLKCTGAPSVQVNNVRIYTDGGGFGVGITVRIGDQYPTKNSGSSAGYEVADANVDFVGGHSLILSATDFFTKVEGAPATVSISEAGNIINALNETTNYVVLQMSVISTASPGDLANETITWKYDEI